MDDLTDDPIVTFRIDTPIGALPFIAELRVQGATMLLRGLQRMVSERMDSMESSLRERFARLGTVRAIDRVQSGSPAMFVLRLPAGQTAPRTIDAIMALARRGIGMLRAKRAIEARLDDGRVFVDLPMVEDPQALTADLAAAGIAAAQVPPPEGVDVRQLRERLDLTREQFAIRYGLELETVRNWEIGKREPDTTARSYLRAIANDPEHLERAYAATPSLAPSLAPSLVR